MAVDRCPKSSDGNHIYKVTFALDTGETVYTCTYCNKIQTFDIFGREYK